MSATGVLERQQGRRERGREREREQVGESRVFLTVSLDAGIKVMQEPNVTATKKQMANSGGR